MVTASGGNHGLGVAYAATRRGVPATIYLPERAPQSTERRLARARRARRAARPRLGRRVGRRRRSTRARPGALLVHPFEDPEVIAGQGTIGLELVEQLGRFDVVVVAIGGGGLIGGIALVAQVAGAVGARRRRRADRRHRDEGLAGGGAAGVARRASTPSPARWRRATSARTRWRWPSRFVDEVVLVSDDEMKAAMKTLWSELRVLVEPAGAAAVAAVAGGHVESAGKRVGVLVCGANLDTALAAEALG